MLPLALFGDKGAGADLDLVFPQLLYVQEWEGALKNTSDSQFYLSQFKGIVIYEVCGNVPLHCAIEIFLTCASSSSASQLFVDVKDPVSL